MNSNYPTNRASVSFSQKECEWLSCVIKTLLAGGDARILARRPECGTVANKTQSMIESMKRRKEERAV